MTTYDSLAIAEPVKGEVTGVPIVEGKLLAEEDTQKVSVTAPLDLPEGYTFYASTSQGHTVSVTVPEGGVKKGHIMLVPFRQVTVSVTGRWKDDIFDCWSQGICHPSFLNACCCRFVLLGQIMTRLKLNWCGNPGAWTNTFCIMVCITIFFNLYVMIAGPSVDLDDDFDDDADFMMYNNVAFLVGLFLLFLIYKVRKHIRAKYDIPEERCKGCEDLCCSLCCGCCVVSQMARHTTDYDKAEAQCCSSRGVQED